jgi:molybdopterin synthase sulfur carrier subunit
VSHTIRVVLPSHLKVMAQVTGEVQVEVEADGPEEVTQRAVLDALEQDYPALLGTIRDRATARRRPFVRFYACEEDLSHEEPDTPLPDRVAAGDEPFLVVGAMAGG